MLPTSRLRLNAPPPRLVATFLRLNDQERDRRSITRITGTRGEATIECRQRRARFCTTCGEAPPARDTALELEQPAEQSMASGVRDRLRDDIQRAIGA